MYLSNYLDDDEQVAEANDNQRTKEAQDGCVKDEGDGPQFMWLRPSYVTGVELLLYMCVDHDWQHNQKRYNPHHGIENLGYLWFPPFGTSNRMDHSQEAIDAHHRQAKGGGELAHGISSHVHFAEEISIWPVGKHTISAQKGNSQDVEFIRQG